MQASGLAGTIFAYFLSSGDNLSSKHEIQNPKQIQMTETQSLELFLFWKFEFCACFGFRYSDFGFYTTLVWIPKRVGGVRKNEVEDHRACIRSQ